MITNFLNFVMVAGSLHLSGEVSFRESLTSVFVTVLPSQFATGLLTAGIAFSYQRLGVGAVGLAAVVLFVFQYLLKAGVEAYDRGEQLEQRTTRARVAAGRPHQHCACRRCRCATP